MTLQNKVDPFGAARAVSARGLFTGNRGIIHDPETKTLLGRRWTTKAWICCALDYRGRRREVMGRNGPNRSAGWTELFFLDEVTALSAGHRPCFTCRREAARSFAAAWAAGRGAASPKVGEIDAVLHAERLASGGKSRPVDAKTVAALPDGTVIAIGGRPHAVRVGRLLPWSFGGYGLPVPLPDGTADLVTPPSIVAALRQGFRLVWHATAIGLD